MHFPPARNYVVAAGCIALASVLLMSSGCGMLRRAGASSLAETFTQTSGSNVFAQDNDPELVGQALPFALKTYEALLASDPQNQDLYRFAAEAFVTYTSAFVQEEAERLEETDFQRAQYLRQRAAKLYLRGRNYALSGLNVGHHGFEERVRQKRGQALKALSPRDVPLLYWAAAGWAGAISADVKNMNLLADLPVVDAMMRRALDLDEGFEDGAIHEFFITYEGERSEAMGGSAERALEHFERVIMLTGGKKASPYVLLASSVAVRQQDYRMFKELLGQALAINPDAVLKWRLSNTLAQEKAKWLLDRSGELFLDYEETEEAKP